MMKAQTQIEKFSNAMEPSFSSGGLNSNEDLPFCDVLTIGLDCFKLKDCLSDQESEFMADLIVTLYKMLLKELEGTLTLFDGNTLSEFVRKEGVSSFDAQIGLNILKGLVKDSKTSSCQGSIAKYKDYSKTNENEQDISSNEIPAAAARKSGDKFQMSQTSTTATYVSLGCWKDIIPRAIDGDLEPIINPSFLYDEHYKRRSNP